MLKPVPSARQPGGTPLGSETIETRLSWLMASAVLIVLTFSYGAPLVIAGCPVLKGC